MKLNYIAKIFVAGFGLLSTLSSVPVSANTLPKESMKIIDLTQNREVRLDELSNCSSAYTTTTDFPLETFFVESQSDHQNQGVRLASLNNSSVNGTYLQARSTSSSYLRAVITNSSQKGFRFKIKLTRDNPNCFGEISGYARWTGNNVAEISEIDDNKSPSECPIKFTFNGNQLSMRKVGSQRCFYHGVNCSFNTGYDWGYEKGDSPLIRK